LVRDDRLGSAWRPARRLALPVFALALLGGCGFVQNIADKMTNMPNSINSALGTAPPSRYVDDNRAEPHDRPPPGVRADQRPFPRSPSQQAQVANGLVADQYAAQQTQAQLQSQDPTQPLQRNGGGAAYQPLPPGGQQVAAAGGPGAVNDVYRQRLA